MIEQSELVREEEFWDKVGAKWLSEKQTQELKVKDAESFLSGSSVAFEYLMAQMGDIVGLRILDYGCGSGWLSTFLAQRGALIDGFDISGKLVELGMKRAHANGVGDRVHLKRMIAEQLTFPDNSFDRIVGISILHHVSLTEGGRELHRVLKPGGKAFFIEPLGESKFQNWIRNYVLRIHHGYVRSVDAEHPLTYYDIHTIGAQCSKIEVKEFQLTEMIARLTGDKITKALGLRSFDGVLLDSFPFLRKYCRLVVITYSK
jgi:2-polyprenyl-3-methyl-5-hydroxy-6-metoxy-1,4-benzoquinol methylase